MKKILIVDDGRTAVLLMEKIIVRIVLATPPANASNGEHGDQILEQYFTENNSLPDFILIYEAYSQIKPSAKNLRRVRETLFMEEKMGEGLGRSPLLQRPLQDE